MGKAIAAGFVGLAAIAYPIAVYIGLSRFGLARISWAIVACAVLLAGLRWLSRGRRGFAPLLLPPVVIAFLAMAGWKFHEPRLLLATPSLINVALLVSFGQSLWFAPPMVERFARLAEPSLSESEVTYCRQVTKVWCGFFAFNAIVAGGLAWAAPLAWWATYTGLISYVLVGLLMTAEYMLRKRRFQKFGTGPHDRFLALFLSTKSSQP
jgi:uncharacterized membrane protein